MYKIEPEKSNWRGINTVPQNKKCEIICDKCGKEFFRLFNRTIRLREENNGEDLCSSCITSGTCKGKTYEERLGKDKAKHAKEKLKQYTGERASNWNGKWRGPESPGVIGNKNKKGKTYEEIYGLDKANEIKKKFGDRSGKNNPMYGKPSPSGSGNGWSGWYKGYYFRSLLELAFMVSLVKQGKSFVLCETQKYAVSYRNHEGKERTYFPDFEVENIIYEIKPYRLVNAKDNVLKFEAAKKQFPNFIVMTEKEIDMLSDNDIQCLYENGEIKFIERYEQKYKEKYAKVYGVFQQKQS